MGICGDDQFRIFLHLLSHIKNYLILWKQAFKKLIFLNTKYCFLQYFSYYNQLLTNKYAINYYG